MSYSYNYGIGSDTIGLMVIFGILVLFFAIFIILAIVLNRSMADATAINSQINQILVSLPNEKNLVVNSVYANAKKELGVGLLLAFLLGSFGGHKIYLGQKTPAILFLLFSVTGIPAIISLFDAVNMPRTIAAYNLNIIDSLKAQLAD